MFFLYTYFYIYYGSFDSQKLGNYKNKRTSKTHTARAGMNRHTIIKLGKKWEGYSPSRVVE